MRRGKTRTLERNNNHRMRANELDQLQREERLRLWRSWSWVAALIAYGLASTTVWVAVGNPKTWASAYHALATAGGLAWLALPLLVLGSVLVVAGLVLTVLLAKHEHKSARV